MIHVPKIEQLIVSTMATADFARSVGLKAQTVRKAYSQKGSVLGIRPIKLPNGKLRWPTSEIAKLLVADEASAIH